MRCVLGNEIRLWDVLGKDNAVKSDDSVPRESKVKGENWLL